MNIIYVLIIVYYALNIPIFMLIHHKKTSNTSNTINTGNYRHNTKAPRLLFQLDENDYDDVTYNLNKQLLYA